MDELLEAFKVLGGVDLKRFGLGKLHRAAGVYPYSENVWAVGDSCGGATSRTDHEAHCLLLEALMARIDFLYPMGWSVGRFHNHKTDRNVWRVSVSTGASSGTFYEGPTRLQALTTTLENQPQ